MSDKDWGQYSELAFRPYVMIELDTGLTMRHFLSSGLHDLTIVAGARLCSEQEVLLWSAARESQDVIASLWLLEYIDKTIDISWSGRSDSYFGVGSYPCSAGICGESWAAWWLCETRRAAGTVGQVSISGILIHAAVTRHVCHVPGRSWHSDNISIKWRPEVQAPL